MHLKPDQKINKKVLIAGSAALLVIIAILIAILFRSCSQDTRFEKYYEEGLRAYTDGEYEEAAQSLEKALKYGESEDCYVLLANTYYTGLNDVNKAIETLYIGASKIQSKTIDEYLEALKGLKSTSTPEPADVAVTIAGDMISRDVTSLVLSQQRLTSADIAPLAELTKLTNLSLTDNGITDVSVLSGLNALTLLQLGNNKITDITPLSGLTNLETLYLDGNAITSFAPLHSLRNLKTLSIKNTGISDEDFAALKKALPDCNIRSDKSGDEVVEITLGGVTFMSDVTELDLSGKGIKDISELSKCTSLEKLDLRDNKISDLTPLMDLSELSWLCIWNNEVEDVLPLMGLSKLSYLDADHNKITDITAVSGMLSLEELWLSGNDISSIKPIAKLSSLKRLGLKATGLDDNALKNLETLTSLKELAIEDNVKLTAEGVDALKAKLKSCTVTHSELTSTLILGGVTYKSDAQSVMASGKGVTSLAGLDKFKKLSSLQLTNTAVSDLSPLSGLTELTDLDIWSGDASLGGSVSDLGPLAGLTKLSTVNLMWNKITDISALSGATGITELYLGGNSISDISPLANMPLLSGLTLDHCPINSLAPISGLTALRTLSMQNCGLNDISALSGLTSLRELYLGNNNISDVSALYGLTSLESLHISYNNLAPWQIIELQEMLPNCTIYTDLDLTPPAEDELAPQTIAAIIGG